MHMEVFNRQHFKIQRFWKKAGKVNISQTYIQKGKLFIKHSYTEYMTNYSITLNIHLCYIKFFTRATFCIKKKTSEEKFVNIYSDPDWFWPQESVTFLVHIFHSNFAKIILTQSSIFEVRLFLTSKIWRFKKNVQEGWYKKHMNCLIF